MSAFPMFLCSSYSSSSSSPPSTSRNTIFSTFTHAIHSLTPPKFNPFPPPSPPPPPPPLFPSSFSDKPFASFFSSFGHFMLSVVKSCRPPRLHLLIPLRRLHGNHNARCFGIFPLFSALITISVRCFASYLSSTTSSSFYPFGASAWTK